MLRLPVFAAVLFTILAGCSSVQFGRDFDPKQFEARVERGVSTRETVRAWLGQPVSTGAGISEQGERYEEWTYYHGRGSLPNLSDANLRILQVRFNAEGRVMSYSWTGERSR
jgi:outer membrane protein assembly factor BamE (lipoprotein component of BamABCDE complex)